MAFRRNHFPSKQKPDTIRDIYNPLKLGPSARYRHVSRYAKVKQVSTKHDMHPNRFIPQAFEKTRCRSYHETVNRRFIPESSRDSYHQVTSTSANRLDIIAADYYNDPTLWWVIAEANSKYRFDPYNIPVGVTLRIPCMETLYKSGGVLDGR